MNFELSENCLRLSELFPDISLKHISHILTFADDNFDSAVEQLLNYEIIKDELDKMVEKSNTKDDNSNNQKQNWVLIDKKMEDPSGNIQNNKNKFKKKMKKLNGNDSNMNSNIKIDPTAISANSLDSTMEALKIKELSKKFEIEDEIMSILEIDESNHELVDWYYTENSYNKLSTIYDIMLNFNSEKAIEDQPRNKIETASFDLICSNKVESSDNLVKRSDLIRSGVKYKNVEGTNASGWDELQLLIDDNPELNLPKQFYILAMKWFHGDLGHILHAAILLNECFQNKSKTNKLNNFITGTKYSEISEGNTGAEINRLNKLNKNQLTINRYNSINHANNENTYAEKSLKRLNILENRISRLKNVRDSSNDKVLKSYYSHSISKAKDDIRNHYESVQDNQVMDKIEKAKSTFELDCHNISVKNAIYAIEVSLDYWWNEEMQHRNIMNTKFELTGVCHVKPFIIITGRGLHSAGQIPKIKNASLRFLQQHNYKFDDDGSVITVLGKRR